MHLHRQLYNRYTQTRAFLPLVRWQAYSVVPRVVRSTMRLKVSPGWCTEKG